MLPAVGRSEGILVVWDTRSVSVNNSLLEKYSKSIEVEKDNVNNWWFSSVYGPCKPREDQLSGMYWRSRVMCRERLSVGDFNVVRSLSEKMNSNSLTISMICFDSLIRELVLCDPPLLNAKFTRSNSRASSICCSLYRFLFPEGWLDFFPMLSTNGLIQNYIRSLPFNFGHFKRNLGYDSFQIRECVVEA